MMVTDILTSSFSHSDRVTKYPPTALMLARAGDLCQRINSFLAPFYSSKSMYEPQRSVVSGYRPAAINEMIPGAVPGDAHETCEAVDLEDGNGELAVFCLANKEEMKMYGLFMEDPRYTCTIKPDQDLTIKFRHGWVHLQNKAVPSGNTIFIPYDRPPP